MRQFYNNSKSVILILCRSRLFSKIWLNISHITSDIFPQISEFYTILSIDHNVRKFFCLTLQMNYKCFLILVFYTEYPILNINNKHYRAIRVYLQVLHNGQTARRPDRQNEFKITFQQK